MKEPELRAAACAVAIGVDVGATRLKLALVDDRGRVLDSQVGATPRGGTGPELVERITDRVADFRDSLARTFPPPQGIGLVVPHLIEGPDWIQRWTNNMPPLEGLALRPLLTERLRGRLAHGNDVSAATVAEHLFGAGRGVDRLLLMSIGTGVSIGVIADGELLQYTWATAGDTGMIIVDPEGALPCSCGGRGCLETVASGNGIADLARRALQVGERTAQTDLPRGDQGPTAADVARLARAGDPVAARIFSRAAAFIGTALASYVHIFRPQLILLSGGLFGSSDLLLDGLRERLWELASPSHLAALRGVELSAYPDLGAAVGAASLVLFPNRYSHDSVAKEVQPTL